MCVCVYVYVCVWGEGKEMLIARDHERYTWSVKQIKKKVPKNKIDLCAEFFRFTHPQIRSSVPPLWIPIHHEAVKRLMPERRWKKRKKGKIKYNIIITA